MSVYLLPGACSDRIATFVARVFKGLITGFYRIRQHLEYIMAAGFFERIL
jgi:hypothetical protein